MSDVVSFAEIDGQKLELLPARVLLQTLGGDSGPVNNSDDPLGLGALVGGDDPLGLGTLVSDPLGGLVGGQ